MEITWRDFSEEEEGEGGMEGGRAQGRRIIGRHKIDWDRLRMV